MRRWPRQRGVFRRPQRGRSAGRTPVDPVERARRLLLEAAAPTPEPHALRARHLRVQARTARLQIAHRHRSGESATPRTAGR